MRRWIVVAVIALALVRARTAAACSCGMFFSELGNAARELPREATLYVWTNPPYVEPPVTAKVTMGGNAVPFELELVFTAKRYVVHRLRIHAPTTGELVVTTPGPEPEEDTFEVVDARTPAPPPVQLDAVSFQGLPVPYCSTSGWFLTLAGAAPAAYRLRGTLDDHPVDAYLPARQARDGDGIPRPSFHELELELGWCSNAWLDPDQRFESIVEGLNAARWKDVELSRLELDGTEVVVARGELNLGNTVGELPRFDPPPSPEPPSPPAAVVAPPPEVAWWPVGAGAGGGLVLGGLGWLGLARRRRSR